MLSILLHIGRQHQYPTAESSVLDFGFHLVLSVTRLLGVSLEVPSAGVSLPVFFPFPLRVPCQSLSGDVRWKFVESVFNLFPSSSEFIHTEVSFVTFSGQ